MIIHQGDILDIFTPSPHLLALFPPPYASCEVLTMYLFISCVIPKLFFTLLLSPESVFTLLMLSPLLSIWVLGCGPYSWNEAFLAFLLGARGFTRWWWVFSSLALPEHQGFPPSLKLWLFCLFFNPPAAALWEALSSLSPQRRTCRDPQGLPGSLWHDLLLSIALPGRFQLFKLGTQLSQLREPAVLCVDSSSPCCFWQIVPRQRAGQLGSPWEFFFLSEIMVLHGKMFSMSENHCPHSVLWFCGNDGSVSPIWVTPVSCTPIGSKNTMKPKWHKVQSISC